MGRTLGIDTGGTFTDLVLADGRRRTVVKVPSTPADPALGILAGIAELGGLRPGDHVVHGTTVALNALLTGRVARTAFVTDAGFGDVLEIGRQDRPELYALEPERPAPLVPRARRFELPHRLAPRLDGTLECLRRPTRAELARLVRRLKASRAESVAIGLLHAYARPEAEQELARALRATGLPVTCSATLLRAHREYERFSTAVVNAALVPLMQSYLGSLEARLDGARLSLLQSTGGTLAAARAALEPARVLFSGPAGGVVGATRAAREAGLGAFVAFDMGGTSTDVAFREDDDASPGRAREPVRIGGHPVAVPTLDLFTIGCGGGSLVTVDAGGILHVGPASAGADPGPVAYGRSAVPTVTDAHVQLGHLGHGAFMGGKLALDVAAVERAFAALARRRGTRPVEAAQAVLDVARAAMRRALGVMTMQRGVDPARLALVAFGGAGGLHAAALAQALGMRAALVPRHPGALSALGMTAAEPASEHEYPLLEPLARVPAARRAQLFRTLEAEARRALAGAGRLVLERTLALRYAGQSFELTIAEGAAPARAFHAAHARLYGYALAARELELVALRLVARVPERHARLAAPRTRALPRAAVRAHVPAWFGRRLRVPVLERDALEPGCRFQGPARVEEYSGTTLVPPGWQARISAGGHLVLER